MQISGVGAASRGTIRYANRNSTGQIIKPHIFFHGAPLLPTPQPCHPRTSWVLAYETLQDTLNGTHVPDGINPRNRTRALAFGKRESDPSECVSSDESRACEKSHLSVPPSQYQLGERPPVSVVPLLPTHGVLTYMGRNLRAFLTLRCISIRGRCYSSSLTSAVDRLLHLSGRYSGPYRSTGLYTSFRSVFPLDCIWKE